MTALGCVRVTRCYLVCSQCREGEYGADPWLGISGSLSENSQRLICLAGTLSTSFAKGAFLLQECAGLSVADEVVRRCCHSVGAELVQTGNAVQSVAPRFEQAKGNVEFHTDAAKVNTRENGWKDLKMALFLKRPSGTPVEPSQWRQRTLPKPTGRFSLAALEPIEQFEQRWSPLAKALGVDDPSLVDVHGDGAEWIWNAAARVFPGSRGVLDPFHAFAHISDAVKAVHGESSAECAGAFRDGKNRLIEKGWTGVCEFLAEQLPKAESNGSRPALEAMAAYLASHSHRLDYAQRLTEGRSMGSGPVEGCCKTVGLRLKSRGARWKQANVDRIAQLVCLIDSDGWDQWWEQRK